MATYWEEEEKKRQQAQQQAQQAQKTQQNQQTQQMQTAAQNAPSANLQQQNTYMGNYQPGGTVQQAQQMLQQQMQSKPGAYQSPHMQQVTQLYEQVMNRPKFNYNINAEPIYQQYKNQYVQQGQRAMRDTVGTMAGLTEGYGNSYAKGAGQQEYQRYLGILNAVMPELYGQAYAQYTQEGDELRNNLATAQQMDETAYGRHRDNLGDWQAERDYLTGRYDTEAVRDYNQYMDALGYRTDAYNLAINMMANGMMPDAQMLSMAGLTPEQATEFMQQMMAGSGGGSGSGKQTATQQPNFNAAGDMANMNMLDKWYQEQLNDPASRALSVGAGTTLTSNNALNVARVGMEEELPQNVIERRMMKTMAEQRGTGTGLTNALLYDIYQKDAGVPGAQTTGNLMQTKMNQKAGNTGNANINNQVAQRYGNYDTAYQKELAEILEEDDERKNRK